MATSLVQPDIRQALIAQMLREGTSSAPVQHWTQGASRVANALIGSLDARDMDTQSREAPLAVFDAWQKSQQPSMGAPQTQRPPTGFAPSAPPAPGTPANRVMTAFADMGQPPQQSSPSDPRGIRNNNPLNIEAGNFTQRQPGFAGSDGRFARFENPQQGMDAAGTLLGSYGQRGINTIAGVINRWAPPSDGNPVSAYASFVAKKLGIGPNDPIDLSNPQTRQGLVMAMGEFENGRPIQVAQAGGSPAAMPQGGAPQTQQPPGMQNEALVRQLLQHPNPNVRAYGAQLMQQMIGKEPKDQIVGDQLVRTMPDGRTVPLYDATKKTDDERNLASENKARAERGLPPLSITEFKATNKSMEVQGQHQGEAVSSIPGAQTKMNEALLQIEAIRQHKGRLHGFSSLAAPYALGTPQYDFVKRVDQAKGGAFLQAYEILKGGGAIANAEGEKATQAVARMDRATSREDFDAALNDYERAIRRGFASLQQRAGQGGAQGGRQGQSANDPLGIR